MTEQPEGAAAKKAAARKTTGAKKTTAKKTTAKKTTGKQASGKQAAPPGKRPAAEKTATPRSTAGRRATANKTTAPRATKQATKKASAPVEEAERSRPSESARSAQRPEPSGGLIDSAAGAAGAAVQLVAMPVTAVRRVLDSKGGLPAYVGAGVLAVTGVVQWPVAAAGTAGYAALRRWGQQLPEPLRTLTGSAPQQRPAGERDDTGADGPA